MRPSTGPTILACLALLVLAGSGADAQQAPSPVGVWRGTVSFGPSTFEIELEIRGSPENGLAGHIANLSRSDPPAALDLVELDGSTLRVRACRFAFIPVRVGVVLEGTLNDDGSSIRGAFDGLLPVELTRAPSSTPSREPLPWPSATSDRSTGSPCDHPARVAAERVIGVLPGVVARGDRAEFRTFAAEHFTINADAVVSALSRFHHGSRGFELHEIRQAGSNWAAALLRNQLTGDWITLSILAELEAPHRVIAWAFFPASPPDAAVEMPSERRIARELEAYVERLAEADVFSGTVLLAKDGEIVFEGAYGMANKDFAVPNTMGTKFKLSSMTKMFTAVAIMQLVEAGELSLSDPLAKFLPGFPDEASAEKIRIEHLLSHTAGLGNFVNQQYLDSSKARYRTVDDFMRLTADETLQFEPGTRYQYSNTGFLVLGKLVEVVTGQDYYDYVREHIYEPAGMSGSGHYQLDHVNRNLAVGYDRQYADEGISYLNNTYIGFRGSPAGSSYSTARDLLKFADAWLGNELLGREHVERMLSADPELVSAPYGYGFDVNTELSRVGHAGGSLGAYSNLDMFLDTGWIGIVLSNYSEGGVPAYPSVIGKIRELVGGGLGGPG